MSAERMTEQLPERPGAIFLLLPGYSTTDPDEKLRMIMADRAKKIREKERKYYELVQKLIKINECLENKSKG